MADETLTLELDGGPVVIKLRPDLAPKHVERITVSLKPRLRPAYGQGWDQHGGLEKSCD